MTPNKFFSALSIVLSIFFFSVSTNAATLSLEGGPRHIIHAYSGVKVVQPSHDALTVTVTNENGEIVAEATTTDLQTSISTEGWEEGHYTVELSSLETETEVFSYVKN